MSSMKVCAIELSVMLFLGAAGPGNAEPESRDEHLGTWTTNREAEFQKVVWDARGFRQYTRASDNVPLVEGASKVIARWKDAEGNTWFRLLDTVTRGPFRGMVFRVVQEVSRSGREQELVSHLASEPFDPREDFPVMDPFDVDYARYDRAGD